MFKGNVLENNKTNLLEITGVNFRYLEGFELVLKNINLTIQRGEYVVFIGHNGCGKSTLAKLIANVLKLQEGQVTIFNKVVNEANKRYLKQKVGIIFDNPDYQLIGATVKEDIIFGLENFNVEVNKMDAIVKESLEQVGLSKFINSAPSHLSGGQKQKAALATILANKPEVVIFDEALSMLDASGKTQISEVIHKLRKELGQTIISITHDMEEIKKADKVVVFNDGQIVAVSTYHELAKNPHFLKKNHLDLPFSSKLSYALEEANFPITKYDQGDDELVKELCLIMK